MKFVYTVEAWNVIVDAVRDAHDTIPERVQIAAAAGVTADGASDPEVLAIAATAGRVVVSRDVATMPGHFTQFVKTHESPGLILIPWRRSIGSAIEALLLVG